MKREWDIITVVQIRSLIDSMKTRLKEVREAHIRINTRAPDVKIKKTSKDGIRIGKTCKVNLTDETITAILRAFRINNAVITFGDRYSKDNALSFASEVERIIRLNDEIAPKGKFPVPPEIKSMALPAMANGL